MRKPIEFAAFPKALAARATYGPYRAVVAHIVDGDTFYVFVDIGLNEYPFRVVRLRGVDTPELNTAAGKATRDYVARLMPVGTPCVLTTYKDVQSFGRYVADVTIDSAIGPSDLAEHLIVSGYGERVSS